jgi:cytochrome b pre-mRNA-processing protein 3
MLNALRKSAERRKLVERLCAGIIARARAGEFFAIFHVPDTIDGRFDLVTLHAWLVLGRLQEAGARDLAQGITDSLFIGFDEALRDLGVGDMGLGPRMKKMANAFYGRVQAYGAAANEAELADAILRNVYRGDTARAGDAKIFAAYVNHARAQLAQCDLPNGALDFGAMP